MRPNGQIFEWPVDDTDVRRDKFVDVDWLVKRGSHIADHHMLVLRMEEPMLFVYSNVKATREGAAVRDFNPAYVAVGSILLKKCS